MAESKLSRHIRTKLRSVGVDVAAIENAVGSGMPDLNCCKDGYEFWVEVKEIPELKPSQVAWIMRRVKFGGKIWIMWKDGSFFRVYHGSQASTMFDEKWRNVPHLELVEGRIDWEKLVEFFSFIQEKYVI